MSFFVVLFWWVVNKRVLTGKVLNALQTQISKHIYINTFYRRRHVYVPKIIRSRVKTGLNYHIAIQTVLYTFGDTHPVNPVYFGETTFLSL